MRSLSKAAGLGCGDFNSTRVFSNFHFPQTVSPALKILAYPPTTSQADIRVSSSTGSRFVDAGKTFSKPALNSSRYAKLAQ